jgi:hypothetical protein
MRIHGLCLVKNEADIIEQTLRVAAGWCDWIYVLDNGSSDGTWERVCSLAAELPAIVPYKQCSRPYTHNLRSEVFRYFAPCAREGDWWCILDADELYIDDPRDFVASVDPCYKAVWAQQYNYLFTDRDLVAYRQNPELYDPSVPVQQKFRYYTVACGSQLRLFRHSNALTGISNDALFPVYPRRIRIKHFMYRSPEQIRTRLRTRHEPMQRGAFVHERQVHWSVGADNIPHSEQRVDPAELWMSRVTDSSKCYFDNHDGTYAEPGDWTAPPAPTWTTILRLRTRAYIRKLRWSSRSIGVIASLEVRLLRSRTVADLLAALRIDLPRIDRGE